MRAKGPCGPNPHRLPHDPSMPQEAFPHATLATDQPSVEVPPISDTAGWIVGYP